MEFETVQFFEYNIRSTVIDDVRMYLVADLMDQYNNKHGTNKKFKSYLRNQHTQELLQNWPKSVGAKTCLRFSPEKENKHWSINGVIKYISFCITTNGGINKGYVVCEKLLIACLMWFDQQFAIAVYTFLEEQRAKDNNFLQQTIQQLQAENNKLVNTQKQMQNRHVHDEKEYQWTYVLTVTRDEVHNTVYLRSRYVHQPCKGKKTIRGGIYYVKNIPNGYELRYRAYDSLLNIAIKYGGNKMFNQRCTFFIPLEMWDLFTEEILAELHVVLKQIRQAAGWRTDLDYNPNKDLDKILGLSDFHLGCGY